MLSQLFYLYQFSFFLLGSGYDIEYYVQYGCFNDECVHISIGDDDDIVEMREPLILRLETVSNFGDRRIVVSGAEAMVIIEEDGM